MVNSSFCSIGQMRIPGHSYVLYGTFPPLPLIKRCLDLYDSSTDMIWWPQSAGPEHPFLNEM